MSGNNVSWQPWPTTPVSTADTAQHQKQQICDASQRQQVQLQEQYQQEALHLLDSPQRHDSFAGQANRPRSGSLWPSHLTMLPSSLPPPPPMPSHTDWDRPIESSVHSQTSSMWPSASQPLPHQVYRMVTDALSPMATTATTIWPSHCLAFNDVCESGTEGTPRTTGPALRGGPAPSYWPLAYRQDLRQPAVTTASLTSSMQSHVFHDSNHKTRLPLGTLPAQGRGIPGQVGHYSPTTHTTTTAMQPRNRFVLADSDGGGNENKNNGNIKTNGHNSDNKENIWPLPSWGDYKNPIPPSTLVGGGRGVSSHSGSSLGNLDQNRMIGGRSHGPGPTVQHQHQHQNEKEMVSRHLTTQMPPNSLFFCKPETSGSSPDARQTDERAKAVVVANVRPAMDKAVGDDTHLQRKIVQPPRRPLSADSRVSRDPGRDRCDRREKEEEDDDGSCLAAGLTSAVSRVGLEEQMEKATKEKEDVSVAETAMPAANVTSPLVHPPAPGFMLPATGYEFELNHDKNLHELRRQKQWAQAQLQSCNENNRFQHTQTTACVAAVNGHILGGYHPASLRCYGTNPEIAGLRVTMTVYGAGVSNGSNRSNRGRGSDDDPDGGDNGDGEGPMLVLRHQIIVVQHNSHHHHYHTGHSCSPNRPVQASPAPLTLLPSASAWPSHQPQPQRLVTTAENSVTGTAVTTGRRSFGRVISSNIGPPIHSLLLPPSHSLACPALTSAPLHPAQGRRYLFATTKIPLRGGVATRPGYRPVTAVEAAERLRQWGGRPDHGVFGNAWLVHQVVESGHVQHVVDTKVMEQVARVTTATTAMTTTAHSSTTMRTETAPLDATATMRRVNEHMQGLARKEGTLSIMLSNHGTQKRIARQCPDLVAMWVLAQENL